MGELTRFTLVRDIQRSESEPGSGVPLFPSRIEPGGLVFFDELRGADTNEAVVTACNGFLDRREYTAPESLSEHPIGMFSAWLRARGDRATFDEIYNESPIFNDPREDNDDDLWVDTRVALAQSFLVALLLSDTDAKVAPQIHRLLLAAALAVDVRLRRFELLERIAPPAALVAEVRGEHRADIGNHAADRPAREREVVFAAMRKRRILLPTWLSRYPERTLHTEGDLKRVSQLVREPAMSDFYVVEDEWHRYEAAEIAHIENLLPHEGKLRTHTRRTETETTESTETETTDVTEKDTQQVDSTEFSVNTQSEMKLSFGLDLSVDTAGQYGPTNVQTHLAAELDGSLQSAEQTAFRVSREVTNRASSRLSQRVRSTRTTRALTRITETNRHELDNTDGDNPVVGIYRWVEQVRRLRVMRYPNRYLLEFLVPEPAAWWRWLAKRGATKGVTVPKPIAFTANKLPASADNPELTAAAMTADPADAMPAYVTYAGRYSTVGVDPPPQSLVLATSVARSPGLKTNAGVTGIAAPNNEGALEWNKDSTIAVPGGWEATKWRATILAWHDSVFDYNDTLDVWVEVGAGTPVATTVGEGESMSRQISGEVGPISTGSVPIGVMLNAPIGYHIGVEVTCVPTTASVSRWQQRTYEAVRQAYDLRQAEYNEAVSAAQTRAGVSFTGLSPARAREVEQAELKKLVISLMRGSEPGAPQDPWNRGNPGDAPVLVLNRAPRDELMFLEQAIEWESMRYVHYPYFWAEQTQWEGLADLSAADPVFAAFLRAGSTRVVVPARPSFEDAVNFYTRTLIPWGGLGAPAPDEDGYLSIADEVAALGRGPVDGTQVGHSWEVRLATELTCLDDRGLPTNQAGRIPAPPDEP